MIEWIQLNEVQLLALYTYETYVHEDTDDVVRLDAFMDLGCIYVCEITQGFNPHVYWYRSDVVQDIEDSIDTDKRLHKFPPTNDWWELDEEELSDLYLDDTVCLSGTYHPLTEFALAVNEYGEDIFYLDTKEYRYFFFKSSWKLLIEEDC